MPPVSKATVKAFAATILVHRDRFLGIPVRALLARVCVHVWFPPEVLPVVCIHTGISLMRLIHIRAPHALVVEQVEISIFLEFADQVYRQFGLIMRKRTILSVVAKTRRGKIRLAELGLVLVRVIKLLHPCVAVDALVPLWALLFLRNKTAQLR